MRSLPFLVAMCVVAAPLSAEIIERVRVNDAYRDEDDRANAVLRAQQSAARAQMESARLKVIKAFEASLEWVAATAEVKAAQEAYNAASKTVINGLKAKPEYQQAVQRESESKATVAAHQQNPGTATPEQLTTPATVALDAASDVTKMEEAALAADKNASDAKSKLAEATAKLNAITQRRDAAVLADPEWITAKKQFDSATVTAAQSR
jgi:hypothetical protein